MTRIRAALIVVSLSFLAGCAGPEKKAIGLDVDVYLHPTSSDSSDVLLQAGIDKRLAESDALKGSIVHVRVTAGVVMLNGAVKSQAAKDAAQQIAQQTNVTLNGVQILPDRKITNQIEIQP
jgi:osmotically-inducible protein OsmY